MFTRLEEFAEERPWLVALAFFLIGSLLGGCVTLVFPTSKGGVITTTIFVKERNFLCEKRALFSTQIVVEQGGVYVAPLSIPCLGIVRIRLSSPTYGDVPREVEFVMSGNGTRLVLLPSYEESGLVIYRVISPPGFGAVVVRNPYEHAIRLAVNIEFEPINIDKE
ncbi:MAG: hypothetical protein DRO12_00295 [Thermoprotei archaeon]|nr:MAG: hypothetical protein DRO12_00295 [Thermoprotei archaeon]